MIRKFLLWLSGRLDALLGKRDGDSPVVVKDEDAPPPAEQPVEPKPVEEPQALEPTPEPEVPVQRRFELDMLPAHNGDSLLLGFEDAAGKIRQIWIDGGWCALTGNTMSGTCGAWWLRGESWTCWW